MELLESALAFAVVMILLSTIATGIVEAILRLLRTRQEILKSTMESLFETIIWPRLKTKLAASDGDTEMLTARGDFVDSMTLNPAKRPVAKPQESLNRPSEGLFARIAKPIRWLISGEKRVDSLSTIAFAERLGRTAVGQAILTEADKAIEPLIQDFARSFERFGRASSEVFRTRAKLVAIVVGIALAFAANIDAGRLFTTLMDNPKLRQSLIEQVEEAAKDNQETVNNLAKLLALPEPDDQAGQPSTSPKSESVGGDQADEQTTDTQNEGISKVIGNELKQLRIDLATLQSKGLPIGHRFYPYCTEGAAGDPACTDPKASGETDKENKDAAETKDGDEAGEENKDGKKQTTRSANDRNLLYWFLLTLTAGVLIGLGGPFWFRVFSSLSQVVQLLRAVGVGSKPQQVNPEQIADDAEVEESVKPKSVLDAFLVAAKTHAESLAATNDAAGGAAQIANGQADQGQGQP